MLQNYYILNKINNGRFGIVYKAKSKIDNKFYAIKITSKRTNEAEILFELCDKVNIVNIKDYFYEDENHHIVEEHCEKGDLYDESKNKTYTETEVSSIIKQVLTGMDACHDKGIGIFDIKPANILIFENNTYKICDFGTSQYITDAHSGLYRQCGTPLFIAPEVFKKNYGHKADIYSLGVMTYFLLTKEYPYKMKVFLTKEDVMKLKELDVDKNKLSKNAYDFVIKCLDFNKYERIGTKQALLDLFVNNK